MCLLTGNKVVERWNGIVYQIVVLTALQLIYLTHIYLNLELETRINNVRQLLDRVSGIIACVH